MTDEEENKEYTEESVETVPEAIKTLLGTMSEGTTGPEDPEEIRAAWYPPASYPPTTTATTTTATSGSMATKPAPETVTMPSRFTSKTLLAFLEENEGAEDELVWAAHLLAKSFEMRSEGGEIILVMEFSLRDYYGNNKSAS